MFKVTFRLPQHITTRKFTSVLITDRQECNEFTEWLRTHGVTKYAITRI